MNVAVLLVLVQQSAALVWNIATTEESKIINGTTVTTIEQLTSAVSPPPLRNRWQHHIRTETHGSFLRNHHPQMSCTYSACFQDSSIPHLTHSAITKGVLHDTQPVIQAKILHILSLIEGIQDSLFEYLKCRQSPAVVCTSVNCLN